MPSIVRRTSILLALLAAAPAHGAVFWLGGGGAPCNFSDLSTAIGAVGQGDTIRIASNQAYTDINLDITNKAVTLEGGWADCAGTPSTERTVLEGAAGAGLPVLHVEAAGTPRFVRLDHLVIRGGTRSGLEVAGLVDVRLEDTVVNDNVADNGGGIRVAGTSPTATTLRLVHSIVGSPDPGVEPGNTADQTGGGVRCSNGRVQLSSALIQGNAADFGAGLYVQACNVDAAGPALDVPGYPPLSAMIRGNTAAFFGGGLYAELASDISLDTDDQPVAFDGNTAGRGGGVYLIGTNTHFDGAAITIRNNTADFFGGGVYLQDGATFTLSRGAGGDQSCLAGRLCSRIVGNEVGAAPSSGASAIEITNATASVSQTEIVGNLSHPNQATFYISDGSLRIDDSLIRDNDAGEGHLFRLYEANSHLVIDAATIVGNVSASRLVDVSQSGGTDTLFFGRSVIWQPGLLVHNAPEEETVTVYCMNAHPGSGIDAVTDDPGFVDAGAGDYRLRADSPNVDACASIIVLGGGGGGGMHDILGTLRPITLFDDTTPLDRGAYELTDVIFADGFDPPGP